jgi:hypothetical protein
MKITKSNFYDFTGDKNILWYKIKAIIFPNAYYYYDERQRSWCYERKNIRGIISDCPEHDGKKCFIPLRPFLYHQILSQLKDGNN